MRKGKSLRHAAVSTSAALMGVTFASSAMAQPQTNPPPQAMAQPQTTPAPSAMAQPSMNQAQLTSMISAWPMSSQKAAMDMMQKYGPPQEATPTMLLWRNNGPWKYTMISNMEVPHNFPMPHPDVLKQAINYDVPASKYDEMAAYDGSVILERTKGELAARCDKEGANFLAVNLANDVATGRRSVADARAYYARAMDTFMKSGTMDRYMQALTFQPPARSGDPDRPAKSAGMDGAAPNTRAASNGGERG